MSYVPMSGCVIVKIVVFFENRHTSMLGHDFTAIYNIMYTPSAGWGFSHACVSADFPVCKKNS